MVNGRSNTVTNTGKTSHAVPWEKVTNVIIHLRTIVFILVAGASPRGSLGWSCPLSTPFLREDVAEIDPGTTVNTT